MNHGGNSLGPRSLIVLACAAVAGIALAAHGWSVRDTPPALGSLGGHPPAASGTTPTAGPHRDAASPARTASPAPATGPLLSSQSYAQYAFLVWPGRLTIAAKAAETGLSITVHSRPGGLDVTAGAAGQQPSPAQFYPAGAHVYVIEATLGDDSGSSDYSLGDDGLVVTDAHGRIVR